MLNAVKSVQDFQENEFIKFAIKVATAWLSNNYVIFFGLIKVAPGSTKHILQWCKTEMQQRALRAIEKRYEI